MTRTVGLLSLQRMPSDEDLLEVLETLRTYGAVGETSLPHAIRHAEAFLAAIPAHCEQLIDLGSGGGLPALVIACRLPLVTFVLTDRRERRTDLLRRACLRLDIADRVTVLTGDVMRLCQQQDLGRRFDVVTARSFGPPLWTLMCAAPFLTESGVAIVSEPPDDQGADRWPEADLLELNFSASAEHFQYVKRLNFTLRA